MSALGSSGSVVLASPGSGAGQTTLQGAYDNDPTGAQILLDAVPNPLSVQASVSGEVWSVADTLGTKIWEIDSDPDLVIARAGVTIDNAFLNGGASTPLTLTETYTQTGAFIGGGILSNGTVTTAVSTTWIWALLQESKLYQIGINPAFAAFTLFNAIPTIRNSGNFNLPQALILNAGLSHRRITAGTSTTIQNVGLSNAGSTRADVAGATMTMTTGHAAVRNFVTFTTVAGSVVNMGTVRGLHNGNPAVALFGTQTGVENLTAYIGVEQDAVPFGGNVTKRALRSALTAATNTLMIENTGGAASDFGAGGIHFDDAAPVQFGGTAFNSQDVSYFWNGSGWMEHFFAANSDSLRWSAPSADRFLLTSNDAAVNEFNFDFRKMSFGQSGAVGNQKVVFASKAETITVGGEYSQYLLTQSANDTINAALGLYAGWTINAPTPTLGTGSLTSAVGLNVAGNPGTATVNRVGLRILSNPSGGSGINAALWVTAGLSRFDGRVDINQPIALGGGAAATLGTIGGSGPTAAAQAQWVEIDINGVAHWIPAWT